jgi:nucleotide-binding universal stress UspA family protein
MTATQGLLVVVVVWLAIGLTASVVMGRRGHSAFEWLVVGSILGPLSVPVAMSAVRSGRDVSPRELTSPVPGGGAVDVLVGIDGSEASHDALRRSVALLGDRIGRLVLATVVDVETATSGGPALRDSEAALDRLAGETAGGRAGSVVLSGLPANALKGYAAEHDFDLLVVGRRGRGATKALLGSTAAGLGHGSPVPLLIA